MADNVTANAGSGGAVFATDDIGGVHYPITKVSFGVLDGVTVVDDATDSRLPVKIGDALPAGANTIGSVNAIQSGSWSISGTVTVDGSAVTQPISAASLPLPAGAATAANQLPDGHNVTVDNAAGASAVNIQDGGNSITVDGTVTAANAAGDVAHDAIDSGNPIKIGAVAESTEVAAVADGDRTNLMATLNGKLVTHPYAVPERFTSGVTAAITGTANTAVIATPGAGVRLYITQLLITNSHATVGTVVEIKDGTTVLYRGYAVAAGGGFSVTLPVPLRLTANTALNAANVTTGSNTYVSASGYIAP